MHEVPHVLEIAPIWYKKMQKISVEGMGVRLLVEGDSGDNEESFGSAGCGMSSFPGYFKVHQSSVEKIQVIGVVYIVTVDQLAAMLSVVHHTHREARREERESSRMRRERGEGRRQKGREYR